ncbi:hypothetical protein Lal_00000665 [Lupinus albus]|nr:hypothetical protein Lal_00000665 [Lupinus albus]
MRKDPKVGGGSEGTCKVTQNPTLTKGKDIGLDIQTFYSICCDIPMTCDITGFGLVCDWDDYDRKRFYPSICRIPKEEIERRKQQSLGETIKNRDILFVGYLTLKNIETKLHGVSLDGETKVALNLRESKIDIEVFHKKGFVLDPITRRTYKHRTDCQTAPTNQPEPTAPNQPEFQAPSSSFVVMPSNKMIMDELVSLRGYITTRMDAIHTQNHQIHYELHRLSSRLNSMDINEDSSKPES